jgi:hypothetical protein
MNYLTARSVSRAAILPFIIACKHTASDTTLSLFQQMPNRGMRMRQHQQQKPPLTCCSGLRWIQERDIVDVARKSMRGWGGTHNHWICCQVWTLCENLRVWVKSHQWATAENVHSVSELDHH